jgi:hypothetical protein
MTTQYTPKGSMCMACKHRERNCMWLEFEKMAVIEKLKDGTLVVKCVEFENKSTTKLGENPY